MNPLALLGWQRFIVYGAVAAAIGTTLVGYGFYLGVQRLWEYQAAQAKETIRVVVARGEVVRVVETKYVPIIKKIYVQGETIEREVIRYVTKEDDAGCAVPVGFVRSFNAAWSGTPAGSPAESDRGASGVPLSAVAETDAANAKSCLAYKAQRDGVIEFYRQQQAVK